jgi:hypothetical protein
LHVWFSFVGSNIPLKIFLSTDTHTFTNRKHWSCMQWNAVNCCQTIHWC